MKKLAIAAALALLPFSVDAFAGTSLSYRLAVPDVGSRPSISWGKDPFVPITAGEGPQASDLKLSAVFYNAASPSAIVNDKIVYRGSVVAGQKVIDIGVTHVILQGDRGRLRLELSEIPELHNATKKD